MQNQLLEVYVEPHELSEECVEVDYFKKYLEAPCLVNSGSDFQPVNDQIIESIKDFGRVNYGKPERTS